MKAVRRVNFQNGIHRLNALPLEELPKERDMLTLKSEITLPDVGLTGFEAPLGEDERAIQGTVHQFAKNVLRPIGRELDKMSAADVCAQSSPFWAVFQEAAKMGLDP